MVCLRVSNTLNNQATTMELLSSLPTKLNQIVNTYTTPKKEPEFGSLGWLPASQTPYLNQIRDDLYYLTNTKEVLYFTEYFLELVPMDLAFSVREYFKYEYNDTKQCWAVKEKPTNHFHLANRMYQIIFQLEHRVRGIDMVTGDIWFNNESSAHISQFFVDNNALNRINKLIDSLIV